MVLPKRYYNYNDTNGYANIYFSDSSLQEVNNDLSNIQEHECFNENEKDEFKGELLSNSNGILKIKLDSNKTSKLDLEILLYPDINELKYERD